MFLTNSLINHFIDQRTLAFTFAPRLRLRINSLALQENTPASNNECLGFKLKLEAVRG